jgi:uncharacterized protein YndB with AHSA1/START domain
MPHPNESTPPAPEALKSWFGPGDCQVTDVEFAPEVGRTYSITMDTPQGPLTVAGTFLEVIPNAKLAFTFQWQADPGEPEEALTTVAVEFRAEGEATRLVLTHEGLPSEESRARHLEGWTSTFDNLAAAMV